MNRPGVQLRRLASWICDESAMAKVIDPILADLQWEDGQAATKGQRCAVRTRAWVAYWRVLAWQMVCLGRHPHAPRDASPAGVIGFTVMMTVLTTALLVAPPAIQFAGFIGLAPPLERMWLILLMVPHAAALTLSAGLLLGTLVALSGRILTRRVASLTIVMAFGFSVMALVTVEWLVPSANQAFRERSYRLVAAERNEQYEPPSRGVTEFTSSELRALVGDSENQFFNDRQSRTLQFQIHLRGALSAMPIVCGFLGVGLAAVIARRFVGGAVGVLVCFGIYCALYGGRSAALSGTISPAVGAWAPNLAAVLLALVAISAAMFRRSKRVSVATSTL